MKQTLNQHLAPKHNIKCVRHGMTGMVAQVVGMRDDKMILEIIEDERSTVQSHVGDRWMQSKAELDLFWYDINYVL